MRKLPTALLLLLISNVGAKQPSAPAPIAAPLRQLPWAQLNCLQSTDVHGWLGGHLQEAQYAGDWGDYVSFAKHLRAKADADGSDLLLIDTGDRVDGNGLYDGSDPKGEYTKDPFMVLDVDIATIGNHELYQNVTVTREYTEIVSRFRGNYIASNVDVVDPKTGDRVPLAQRYRKFETKNQGINVLAFGFIFDFTGNSKNSWVQPVKETIKEKWFQEAIREKDVDLIIVAGHVAIRGEEYAALFNAIRSVRWDMPIQFFGGHLHIRDAVRFDDKAAALASGRFLETAGFASIDGLVSHKNKTRSQASLNFQRMYIDNNLYSYYKHTGKNESTFPTKEGEQVSKEITKARKKMQLDDLFGCAPKHLWANRASYPSEDSIFTWLDQKVLPEKVVNHERKDKPHIIFINTGGIRFDIFKGPFTKDSVYIVCPFDSHFVHLQDVPWSAAKRILELLNHGPAPFNELAMDPRDLGPSIQLDARFSKARIKKQQLKLELKKRNWPSAQTALKEDPSLPLIPGYTTQDDFGSDGDDTIHSPISFFPAPNAIQASVGFTPESGEEPKAVDVIFFDFVQPYILLALEFLGQKYQATDVNPYMGNETLGLLMAEWASEHWDMKC